MATRKTPKTASDDTSGPVLTLDDIIRGGDKPLRKAVVPGITVNGKPGIVHYRPVSAGRALGLVNIGENEKDQVEGMIEVLVESVCNEDGSPMFTRDQLLLAPMDSVVSILNAISGKVVKEGNA